MAMYRYKALTEHGRQMEGTLEASGPDQARELLAAMKLSVSELDAARPQRPATPVGREEFALFNQQLASLTKAGIPLEQGLRQLAKDAGSASMQRLMEEIAFDLDRGMGIEEAVERRAQAFPPLYGRILKAGIETGRLSEMLTSLNRHLEIARRTRQIIVESLCYPTVVFVLAITIITFIMLTVVPTFAEVLGDMTDGRSGLPALTRFFLDLSEHILTIWAVLVGLVAGVFILYRMLSFSENGRAVKESILSSIPLLGRILRNGSLARLSETMAVLVGAGCTMPQCLRLAGESSGSEYIRRDTRRLALQIEQGHGLLEAGVLCRTVPMLFLYSVQLGSQRNELQDHLYSLGRMYARQTYCQQTRLQSLMMPALIVFLGGLVGTMVLALFLPMIRMVQVFT